MPFLRLNAIKIAIHCSDGDYGVSIPFSTGLNIIRAKNSTGKSSVFNSIVYALGLEQLLGGTGESTMKPVLRSFLKYGEKTFTVLESKVQLEIANESGQTITATRWIKSGTMDSRLIRVHLGPVLTVGGGYRSEDYFVHMPGAAVEASGFHRFLAMFMGMDLPRVPTFDGEDRLLYIQALFPLFFREQLKGWSTFYSQLPSNFGLRDISKRSIEYVLNLDILESTRKRDELRVRRTVLADRWRNLVTSMRQTAEQAGGFLSEVPLSYPDLSSDPKVLIYVDDRNVIDMNQRIMDLIDQVSTSFGEAKVGQVSEQQEARLANLEQEALALQSAANSLRAEVQMEDSNRASLVEDLETLQGDLSKNQEIKRLYSLGSDIEISIANGLCPTCGQHIKDALLDQDIDIQPMGIDENIKYIREQIEAIRFALEQSSVLIERKRTKLIAVERILNQQRRSIRLLRKELMEDPRMPSQQVLEGYVEAKANLMALKEARTKVDYYSDQLRGVQEEWRKYLNDKATVSDRYFSNSDLEKLKLLEGSLRDYAGRFQYHSGSVGDIGISEDKYTPTIEGYDVRVDSSASDHIRLIWAYVCALLHVSNTFGANHPGLIIMDEPGQQQMALDSQRALFVLLASLPGQHLLASSLSSQEVGRLTEDLPVSVQDLGDEYILGPLS